MVIPPMSEVVNPATVNDRTTHGKTGTDRLCERYQLHGATVLATASTRYTILFRVLNPTSKPTTLYKATTLGNFPILPPTDTNNYFQKAATFEGPLHSGARYFEGGRYIRGGHYFPRAPLSRSATFARPPLSRGRYFQGAATFEGPLLSVGLAKFRGRYFNFQGRYFRRAATFGVRYF